MSRMSGIKRKKAFRSLVRRDGQYCFIGGEYLELENAVIDHWNNSNNDNRLKNLHILCRSMNSVKNPRGLGKKTEILSSVCVREMGQLHSGNHANDLILPQSLEFMKNMECEPTFRHWLFYNIVRLKTIELSNVINSGAEVARCSQVTVRRYIDKVCSLVGMYQIITPSDTGVRMIVLKPCWDTFSGIIEERRASQVQAQNWKKIRMEEEMHLKKNMSEGQGVALSDYAVN
jgi:hypothetical protein